MFSPIESLESRQMMSISSFTAVSPVKLVTTPPVFVPVNPAPVLLPTPVVPVVPLPVIVTPPPPALLPTPVVPKPVGLPVIVGTIPHVTPAYVSNDVLTVEGRLDKNSVGVDVFGGNYIVTLNASTYFFPTYGITGVNISGGKGADSINLSLNVSVPTTVHGNAGNDSLIGGAGNDRLFGDDGDDLLAGRAGADVLSGGNGFDTISYVDTNGGVNVSLDGVANDGRPAIILSSGIGVLARTQISAAENDNALPDVEVIKGTSFDDVLTGDSAANSLYGYGGNDQLNGLDGNDSLYGGAGNDQLNGGNGDDQMWGGLGADVLGGGNGTDAARYDDADFARTAGVTVTIDGVANDGLPGENDNVKTDVETVYGTQFGDILKGSAGNNAIFGGGGNDQLFGLGGNDSLFGTAGNDLLLGGDGNDYENAGDGNDVALGDLGNDSVYAGNGDDQVRGGAGDDQLYGQAGNDKVWGEDGSNVISGDDGNDQLFGGAGLDSLLGGAGDDILVAVGGASDRLTGGTGFDSFWDDAAGGGLFNPGDVLTDADLNEIQAGAVHAIANFANSVSTGPFNAHAPVSKELLGQDLTDPAPDVAGTMELNFRSNPLFATGGPTIDDVNQNALGDCWFLAMLSADVRVNPTRIHQSIVDLGDGTYAVRFRQYPFTTNDLYIRVDADLPVNASNNPIYAGLGKEKSLWVALMEKAFTWTRNSDGTAVQSGYATIAAGTAYEAAEALNMPSIDWGRSFPSVDAAGTWIRDRLNTNRVILLSTSKTANVLYVPSHEYAVVGVHQISAGNWTVTLRNPWGHDGIYNEGADDGYLTMPLWSVLGAMSRIEAFYG